MRLLSATVNNLVGFSDGDPATPAPRTVNAFFDIGSYNSGVKTVAADGLPPQNPTTFDFSGDFAVGNLLGIGTAFPGGISIRSITVDDPSVSVSVPVPATLPLVAAGILGVGAVRRRKPAAGKR